LNQTTNRSNYDLTRNQSKNQYTTTSSSRITQSSTYGFNNQSNESYEPFNLRLPVGKPVTARVKMPSGRIANPSVEQNSDGTVSIKYQPSEVGLHELEVMCSGVAIQGSPFKFHVDALNTLTGSQEDITTSMSQTHIHSQHGYVNAHGQGLTHGFCDEPCEFSIVTKDAGTGGLAVAVEGPSKAEIQCRDNKNGTCDVVYYPTAPGDYTISVKFADKHIVGSPFTARIIGTNHASTSHSSSTRISQQQQQYYHHQQRNQVTTMGNQSDISLKVIEGDVSELYATIKSPSGHEEACMLKKLNNGSLGISFTPREVGEHIVSVFRDNKHIKNSPFRIEVRQSEIGDSSRVKVYGHGLSEGTANQINEFFVNTKDAGKYKKKQQQQKIVFVFFYLN
jgi:filamin